MIASLGMSLRRIGETFWSAAHSKNLSKGSRTPALLLVG